jgi:hypothetical protein
MSMMLVAALMMAQAPAAASQPEQQPAATAPAPVPPAPAAKEKKICKVDQNESSSRLRKTVCKTAAEWENAGQGKDVNDLKAMGAH